MAKSYELSTLETWLTTLNPDMLTVQSIDPNAIDRIISESYRIQRSLQTNFHELKPRHAEQFISMNQMDILRIMDIVEDYIFSVESTRQETLTQFYRDIYAALEKILLHMVKYFPCAINENLPMPKLYTLHEKEKLRQDFNHLLRLYEHPQVPKALLNVALRPLKEFFLRDNTSFTFHKLLYFKFFLHEFLPFVDNNIPPNSTIDLNEAEDPPEDLEQPEPLSNGKEDSPNFDLNLLIHHKLHFINFNNIEYRNYCTSQLHDKLEALPTQEEKIKRVNWYVTTEKRQRPKPGMALEPGLPPISEQILHIIEEEYQYLIEQNNLASSKSEDNRQNSVNKIKLNLTSLELAQLAAVFEESGFLQAKTVDIISHLARNCTTEGGDDLQESSLRTQFYSRNNGAALQKLSTVLQAMLEVIDVKIKKQSLTIFWVITGNSLFLVT